MRSIGAVLFLLLTIFLTFDIHVAYAEKSLPAAITQPIPISQITEYTKCILPPWYKNLF